MREGAVSRYADLKVTSEDRDRENRDLRELLAYLHSRPEIEAREVYRRLRIINDPLAVLRQLRDADTLLALPSPYFRTGDKEMDRLDAEALADSVIKVPARPWTSVAGDGVVSKLISAFFKWDDPFLYSLVDRRLFVRDMRNRQGPYCTPLLVNAICALRRSVSRPSQLLGPLYCNSDMLEVQCDQVRQINRIAKTDLYSRFLSEAKQHLEIEKCKTSLTTAQGLYLLFLVSCHDGTNRAGSMYRLGSLEMLSKLRPDTMFAKLSDQIPAEADKRRAISKACWGIFNFEWYGHQPGKLIPSDPGQRLANQSLAFFHTSTSGLRPCRLLWSPGPMNIGVPPVQTSTYSAHRSDRVPRSLLWSPGPSLS